MSVKTHLDRLASTLNIADIEKGSIDKSVSALEERLKTWFSGNLKENFRFGSSVRKTMLPRKADYKSDVDYMIVLNNEDKYKPQTLLNRVKSFAEYYYKKSEIYQSNPTVVLELNHIKFDLVPSYRDAYGSLLIPAPSSYYEDWMYTYPYSLNSKMEEAHKNSGYELKPALRLLKYWNALNGYVYQSFPLEERMINANIGFSVGVKECFYSMIDNMYADRYSLVSTKREKVERAKRIIDTVKSYERDSMPYTAETEIKKLLPAL